MSSSLTNFLNEIDKPSIASAWLTDFSTRFEKGDVDSLVELFHTEGWFRDFLTFTWDLRTRHGRDQIRSYLDAVPRPVDFTIVDQDQGTSLGTVDNNLHTNGDGEG